MTNGERFKAAPERRAAYTDYVERCIKGNCTIADEFMWLNLEYGEELKPCPFCGGEARIVIRSGGGTDHYQAECKECFCKTTFYIVQEDATVVWNRRAT